MLGTDGPQYSEARGDGVMVKYRNCIDCGYCRYNKKFDYYWCVDRSQDSKFDVDPYQDGCTFGKDIEPEYEDEDKAYERKKYNE